MKEKKFTINYREREMWVLNDEGLYLDQQRSRLSMREYIKQNKEMIDAIILESVNRKPVRQ